MRVEDGVLYIDASELEKAIFCNRVPDGAVRCEYDGVNHDFTKCKHYQFLSECFPLLKQRVEGEIEEFDSDTEKPDGAFFYCPIFKAGLEPFIEPGEYKVEHVLEK